MSPTWKRSKKDKEDETSRWWFSDEDLQEAIANIVDVPPKRGHRRHAEPPDIDDEDKDNGE